MGLTRKMLAAMEISEDKISEIINTHMAVVNEIKDERDALKAKADKIEGLEKSLAEANKQIEDFKNGDWQKKYEALKGEYDVYKSDVETKAVTAKKTEAYKKLLLDAGVSDKRIAAILKVSDINAINLDADGNIEGASEMTENVKKEWADFITTEKTKGADVANPPKNEGNGISTPSRASELVARYQSEHYGNKMSTKEE